MQQNILQENYATIKKESDGQYIHFNGGVFGPYDNVYFNNGNDFITEEVISNNNYGTKNSRVLIGKDNIILGFKTIKDLSGNPIKYLDIINTHTKLDFRFKIDKYNIIFNTMIGGVNLIIINHNDENGSDKSTAISLDTFKIIKETPEKIFNLKNDYIMIRKDYFKLNFNTTYNGYDLEKSSIEDITYILNKKNLGKKIFFGIIFSFSMLSIFIYTHSSSENNYIALVNFIGFFTGFIGYLSIQDYNEKKISSSLYINDYYISNEIKNEKKRLFIHLSIIIIFIFFPLYFISNLTIISPIIKIYLLIIVIIIFYYLFLLIKNMIKYANNTKI